VLPTLAIVLTKSGGNRVPPSASRADGHAIAGHLAATATLAIVYWATWGVFARRLRQPRAYGTYRARCCCRPVAGRKLGGHRPPK
jgi:hypothetical protein